MFRSNFSFRRRRGDGQDDALDESIAATPWNTDDAVGNEAAGVESSAGESAVPYNNEAIARNASIATTSTSRLTGRHNSDSILLERHARGSIGGSSNTHRDPLGLKVLHRPQKDRHVDIIFVHGLGGSSRMTWSKHKKLSHFWPLQFLPLEPSIKDARILTFGYNADFGPGSGKNNLSIPEFAKQLLGEMKYGKDDAEFDLAELNLGERPIIFVVHSMGGLVVKEAYMKGKDDESYQHIISAVSAIVFLSTPHRGTNLAETLNRILRATFVTAPRSFIDELKPQSPTLQSLNESFRNMTKNLDIVSFYETRRTPISGKDVMVLEKDSSVLGYPGEVSTPLDADHHGVCKYENREDNIYKTVRNVIISLVRKANVSDGSPYRQHQDIRTKLEDVFGCKEPPERDYNFFRDRWTEGTCSWILGDHGFQSWLTDASLLPKILWIHGTAASGKSILSSFIINHLAEEGYRCHYFFARSEHKHKRSPSMILRSLAWQLSQSFPAFAEQVRQLEQAGQDLAGSDATLMWQLLFREHFLRLDIEEPVFCVVDGLDEIERPEVLLDLLDDVHRSDMRLRFLLVGRKTSEIAARMLSHDRKSRLTSIELQAKPSDLFRHISQKLFLPGDLSYRETVVEEITSRARGNFLWVHLAITKINRCESKVDVQQALKELPPGMMQLYDRMAHSVEATLGHNAHTRAEQILAWATHSNRPLSIEELGDALDTDDLIDIQRTIDQHCGGFVVVDQEGKVALLHETAREYLTSSGSDGLASRMDRKVTNDKLLRRCLTRLMDRTVRNAINRDRPPPLLNYAASAWFYHLIRGSKLEDSIVELLMAFFQGQAVLTWIHVAARSKQLRSLVITSRFLNEIVLKMRGQHREDSSLYQEAISVFSAWATDLTKLTGKFGTALQRKPDAIYKLIPPFCPEQSLLFQYFGKKESTQLRVMSSMRKTWDDCLARLSWEQRFTSSMIYRAGSRIVVLTNRGSASLMIVYNTATFEEERRLLHPSERVYRIQVDKLGERLMSYGYHTTRFWSLSTGDCKKIIRNRHRGEPHSMIFLENTDMVLVALENRLVQKARWADGLNDWSEGTIIMDQSQQETLTILNAPICSAISPDGELIAFGYRGVPVTVWDLESNRQIGQCGVSEPKTSMLGSGATHQVRTLGETVQLAWHPISGEVFGLQRDGLLFRWDPYEDEADLVIHTAARHLAISQDGALLATGAPDGTIKVFASIDLTLIYQLVAQDSVLDLAFSIDSRRLYDIRGSYGNVWEPSALVRLAEGSEISDHSSDSLGDGDSLADASLRTEHVFPGVDGIVAVTGQAQGALYCYGTEGGLAVLCETGHGQCEELVRLPDYMSIEHLCWSYDGRLVALADLGERVYVKEVELLNKETHAWKVHNKHTFALPPAFGHVVQIMFQKDSQKLLIASATGLCLFEGDAHDMVEVSLPPTMPAVRWMNHPMRDDLLLGFSNEQVYHLSWETAQSVHVQSFNPARPARSGTLTACRSYAGAQSRIGDGEELIGRILATPGSPEVILQVANLNPAGRLRQEYLVFDMSAQNDASGLVAYHNLPSEVVECIREPFALLAGGRLVFLDLDKRVCSWRLPTAGRKLSVSAGSQASPPVEPLYPLPGDWVTANEAGLCSMMPDGTLLCPRNGDIASVQCAKLRR